MTTSTKSSNLQTNSKYDNTVNDIVSGLRANYFTTIIGNFDAFDPNKILTVLKRKIHHNVPGQDGTSWRVVHIRPGLSPFENLAAALARPNVLITKGQVDVNFRKEILKELRSGSSGLVTLQAKIKKLLHVPFNLLLVIDHFDDLFKLFPMAVKPDQVGEDIDFVNLLLKAAVWEKVPIYIVMILPSDLVEKAYRYRGLSKAIQEGSYFLKKPTLDDYKNQIKYQLPNADEELELILRKDLDRSEFDKDFDFKWQYLLNQLKLKGENISTYNTLGGINGIIPKTAEQVYQSFNPRQKKVCERIFMACAEMAAQNQAIVKPVLLSKLVSLNNRPNESTVDLNEIDFVINKFTNPKVGLLEIIEPTLSSQSQSLSPDNTIIKVRDSAVLSSWSRAFQWIKKESLNAYIYQNLVREAIQNRGRSTDGTILSESDLNLTLKLFNEEHPNEDWAAQYFPLSIPEEEWADKYQSTFAIAVEYLRTSQQKIEGAKAEAEARRRRMAKIYKRFAIGMGFLAILAIVALIIAGRMAHNAQIGKENLTQLNFIDLLAQNNFIKISFEDRLQIMNSKEIREIHHVLNHFEDEGILTSDERDNKDIIYAFNSIYYMYEVLASKKGEVETKMAKEARKLLGKIVESNDKENKYLYYALHAYYKKLLSLNDIEGETRMDHDLGMIAITSNPQDSTEFAFADKFGEIIVVNRKKTKYSVLNLNIKQERGDVEEPIRTLEYSKNGKTIYAGTYSGKLFKWELNKKLAPSLIEDYGGKIYHIKLVGDRDIPLLGQKYRIKGPGNPYEFKDNLTEISSMAISSDDRYLMVGGHNNTLLFELTPPKYKLEDPIILNHPDRVNKEMEIFDGYVAIGTEKGKIILFKLEEVLTKGRGALDNLQKMEYFDPNYEQEITGLQFFKNEESGRIHFASCGINKIVKLWDLDQDIQNFSSIEPLALHGHDGVVWDLVFNNEGELLSMGDTYIYFWETNVQNMASEVEKILEFMNGE